MTFELVLFPTVGDAENGNFMAISNPAWLPRRTIQGIAIRPGRSQVRCWAYCWDMNPFHMTGSRGSKIHKRLRIWPVRCTGYSKNSLLNGYMKGNEFDKFLDHADFFSRFMMTTAGTWIITVKKYNLTECCLLL